MRMLVASSAVIMAAAFSSTSAAVAYSGEELAKTAKIDIARASEVALKARPGKITDRELEHESGGSGLRYSFDIRNHGITYEIGVDAMTGRVLENKAEGPNPD